jgi:two-component system sensor histidine kinase QseC
MNSIRIRTITIILVIITLCWLALIPAIHWQTREQLDSVLFERSVIQADLLLSVLEEDVAAAMAAGMPFQEIGTTQALREYESTPPWPFHLWLGGELHARISSAPDFPRPSIITPEVQILDIDGEDWRVLTRRREIKISASGELENGWIVLGIKKNDHEAVASGLVWRSTWPILVSLPILTTVVYFGIGLGLQPLNSLAKQVERRSPLQLDIIDIDKIPVEVAPLVNALNQLFEEVQRTFLNEKRFTADAAHELRTPLSALSAQAQVALRASNDETRKKALRQIVRSVDRLTHLISQLLTLARLDPKIEIQRALADLALLTREIMAEMSAAAIEKNLDFGMQSDASVMVHGDDALLGILVRNLLDNAIKYTPAGGEVTATITGFEDRTELVVTDTGLGIPLEYRNKVTGRFFRIGHGNEPGTGLGLSIVERIVSLHDASLEFRDREGQGVTVAVVFPSKEKSLIHTPTLDGSIGPAAV